MGTCRAKASVSLVIGLLAGTASASNIATVRVGNAGNTADTKVMNDGTTGYGSVSYTYKIGQYEVTTGQYAEFLNAVAKTDTYGLYNTNMDTAADPRTCNIRRTGTSGNYTYSVGDGSPTDLANWANRPVNYINWGDAARFANWMHNGQRTGPQNATTTEDGSYYLNGATSTDQLQAVTRKTNATWVIPSENEWYKAAFYDAGKSGGAAYWNYATRSDVVPSNVLDSAGTNNANFYDYQGPNTGTYTIGSPYYRTPVGAFASSPSAYGTFDQTGNVWEWNESVLFDTQRGMRGGTYYSMAFTLPATWRSNGPTTVEAISLGFRIACIPEPCSGLLMVAGVLGLASGRRRG